MEKIIMEIIFEFGYVLDIFYFLICGVLVMWMVVGFVMFEVGFVWVKNIIEILIKNVVLFVIVCIMYMICGYGIMYGGGDWGLFLSGIMVDGVIGVVEELVIYVFFVDFFF